MAESLKIDVITKTLGIKSLVDVYAAFKMVGAVVGKVKDKMKDLTKAYGIQEQAEVKLQKQAGGSIETLKRYASEMQNLTTVGDETILQTMQLASSMGVSKDQLDEAAEGAIGLSKAYGIDLNTSMKMVALANEEEYNMLARYIPALRTATSDAEKHAIVQKAMADGFELAKTEADTFKGRLEQLNNTQGDLKESGGKLIAIFGKGIVEAMTKSTKALNDFISDTDRINTIMAGWKTFQTVISDVAVKGFEKLKDVLSPLSKLFKDNNKESNVLKNIFAMLGTAVEGLSLYASLLIKAYKMVLTIWVDLIKAGKEVAKVFSTIGDAIKSGDWSTVSDQIKNVGGSFKSLGLDVKDVALEIKDISVTGFKDLVSNSGKGLNDLKKLYRENYAEIETIVETSGNKVDKKTKDAGGNARLSFLEESKQMVQGWKDAWNEMSAMEQFGEVAKKIEEVGSIILDITTQILSQIQEAWNASYETQLEAAGEWKEKHLEGVDDWMANEMERLGVREESRSEQLEREIDTLMSSRSKETDIDKKAAMDEQINEKNNKLKRLQIQDQAEKKRQDIMKKAAKKENEIKKKQFEDNKSFQIGQIWINAASSVMGWWASFASMGIPGIVLAGVMTAATLAMAGVQTGLVASQSFASGGIVQGQAGIDNIPANLSAGELILNKSQQDNLAPQLGSGGTTYYIENFYSSARSLDDAVEEMSDILRYEKDRQ